MVLVLLVLLAGSAFALEKKGPTFMVGGTSGFVFHMDDDQSSAFSVGIAGELRFSKVVPLTLYYHSTGTLEFSDNSKLRELCGYSGYVKKNSVYMDLGLGWMHDFNPSLSLMAGAGADLNLYMENATAAWVDAYSYSRWNIGLNITTELIYNYSEFLYALVGAKMDFGIRQHEDLPDPIAAQLDSGYDPWKNHFSFATRIYVGAGFML